WAPTRTRRSEPGLRFSPGRPPCSVWCVVFPCCWKDGGTCPTRSAPPAPEKFPLEARYESLARQRSFGRIVRCRLHLAATAFSRVALVHHAAAPRRDPHAQLSVVAGQRRGPFLSRLRGPSPCQQDAPLQHRRVAPRSPSFSSISSVGFFSGRS